MIRELGAPPRAEIGLHTRNGLFDGLEDLPWVKAQKLADVSPERIEWLWHGRIPLGKLTVLDGDPGLGKSTIALDLAARVSTGRPMPGETITRPPAGVVLLSAEDGLADTIRPKLDAAGADPERVVAVTGVLAGDGIYRLPTLPNDLPWIAQEIGKISARLVIVDVFMAYLDGAVNAHRDQDVRGALAQLAAVAEQTGAAFLVLRHLNKSAGGAAIYRGGGSIGIVGAARSALLVGRDPADEARLVLAVNKSNLAPIAPSLAYRIVDSGGVGRVEWEGVTSLTASQLLAAPVDDGERTALDAAIQVLRDILAAGPVPARDARRQAREAGVSDATLRRAKDAAGVIIRKVGRPGETGQHWAWSLPEDAHETAKMRKPTGWTSSEPNGHLRTETPRRPGALVRDRAEDDPGRPLTAPGALFAEANFGPSTAAALANDEEWLAAPPTVTDEPASTIACADYGADYLPDDAAVTVADDEEWLAAPLPEPTVTDEPASTIACADYHAHQFQHRRTPAGWVCEACASEPEGAR